MSSPVPEPERPESAAGAGVHDFDAVELDYEAEEEDLEAPDAASVTNKVDEEEAEDEEKRWLAAVAADIDEVRIFWAQVRHTTRLTHMLRIHPQIN